MADAVTNVRPKSSFFEGGNGIALIVIPLILFLCVLFYRKVSSFFGEFGIRIEDVYAYVFNIFAIELGGLLALFALLACKPTPFLERIKNTHAFSSIMMTTKITLMVATVVIALTFVLGIVRLEPARELTLESMVFLAWAALASLATCFYARTVRLIFTALA